MLCSECGSVAHGDQCGLVANDHGGVSSPIPYRCDLLPPLAVLHAAKVCAVGAVSHGVNNWHKITVNDHVNHALAHLMKYLAGDVSEDHLGHAMVRMMFSVDQDLSGRGARLL